MSAMIRQHPDRAGLYLVSTGGEEHVVEAETGICDCAHYRYRLANGTGDLCKHGKALAEYLEAERACPYCGGYGIVLLRVRYADDGPIPCVHCSGSGLRSSGALLDDSELRKMFA